MIIALIRSMPALVAKAIGPWREVLSIEDLPQIGHPEDGMLKVRVISCGLAFPDVLTVEGKHIQRKKAPFVPGSEICGEILEVGQGVTDEFNFHVGDLVFGTTNYGGLQEHTFLPALSAYKLPEGVDVSIGSGFELNC